MKRNLLLVMLSVAVCLLFAPVSAGFVNNISATQSITNPSITAAGGTVNLTIVFSTPNESLTGAIEVNDTSLPSGWGISPTWNIAIGDDPSTGTYTMNDTYFTTCTWSQAQQAWAWSSVTSKTRVYTINYFVTVPAGETPGIYHVNAYALTSPPPEEHNMQLYLGRQRSP